MNSARLQHLIERATRSRGIPQDLSREIVGMAQLQLQAEGKAERPKRQDIARAVDVVQREWSGRLWNALEEMSA